MCQHMPVTASIHLPTFFSFKVLNPELDIHTLDQSGALSKRWPQYVGSESSISNDEFYKTFQKLHKIIDSKYNAGW